MDGRPVEHDRVHAGHGKPDLDRCGRGRQKHRVEGPRRDLDELDGSGRDKVAPFRNEEGRAADGGQHAEGEERARTGHEASGSAQAPEVAPFGVEGRARLEGRERLECEQARKQLEGGVHDKAGLCFRSRTRQADADYAGIVERAPQDELFDVVVAEDAQHGACHKQDGSACQHYEAHSGHRFPS